MRRFFTKNALFLIAFLLAFILSGCSDNPYDVPPCEAISFTDQNGISFSLQITPCTGNKSNGKVTLNTDASRDYLYSADCGKTFKKMRSSEITLDGVPQGSYSVCITESSDPENVTGIYTVYLNESGESPVYSYAVSFLEKIYRDGNITVYLDGSCQAAIDIEAENVKLSDNTVRYDSLEQGLYNISLTDKNGSASATLEVPVMHEGTGLKAFTEVESILQTPELPTGCEVTSLTMLLEFLGFHTDKLTVADNYLPKGEYRRSDYNKVFVGDPRSRRSYGCTAPVIAETAEKFLADHDKDNKWKVINISGCSEDTLYSAVKNGCPVVVWCSIDMKKIIDGYITWTDEATGNTVSWLGREHCLLLTGFDKKERLVYVNDPLRGQVTYDMDLFEERFEDLDRNAVLIVNN